MKAFIALGANMEAPLQQLENCIKKLEERFGGCRRSRIYRTKPVGKTDQADFLNMVVEIDTRLTAEALLAGLHDIEREMGRVRHTKNEPRPIDCDLLLLDAQIIATPTLTLPHPEMHQRDFVLAPLCDLNPHLQHPRLHRTMAELFAAAGDRNLIGLL